jgi:mono/diheme cytochrome c family protein
MNPFSVSAPGRRSSVLIGAILLALSISAPSARADGGALFQANCAGCHGADGRAEGPMAKAMKVPALSGTKLDEAGIAKHVRDNKSHAAILGTLSDDDLKSVAAYAKGL